MNNKIQLTNSFNMKKILIVIIVLAGVLNSSAQSMILKGKNSSADSKSSKTVINPAQGMISSSEKLNKNLSGNDILSTDKDMVLNVNPKKELKFSDAGNVDNISEKPFLINKPGIFKSENLKGINVSSSDDRKKILKKIQ